MFEGNTTLQYFMVKGTCSTYSQMVQKKSVWCVCVCVCTCVCACREREGMSKQENRGKCKKIWKVLLKGVQKFCSVNFSVSAVTF